jgi:CheY-like chemotaxis protein
MTLTSKYVIMLEKDADDIYITQSLTRELGISIPIKFIRDFDELLRYLSLPDKPSLILLSYHTPPLTIEEMLEQLKTNPDFYQIPVVVLCEDISEEDVAACYRMGANSIIKKPVSMETTAAKMQTFFRYWFQVAEL